MILQNNVQLIGNVGNQPKVTTLENGKKVARMSLATNENYKDADGNKKTDTNWHTIVAWGKKATIIENYVIQGKQIAVQGKLKTRKFIADDGNERYVTEVLVNEILLLGDKEPVNTEA